MGLADYQKQKQIKDASEQTASHVREGNDLLRALLHEQQETNRLLALLLPR